MVGLASATLDVMPAMNKQEEPEEGGQTAQDLGAGQSLERHAHGDDPEVEGASVGDRRGAGDAEEDHRCRNGDRAAQDDLGELVGGRGRQPGERDVFVLA